MDLMEPVPKAHENHLKVSLPEPRSTILRCGRAEISMQLSNGFCTACRTHRI